MRATGFSHKHYHTISSTISGAHFYTSPVDEIDTLVLSIIGNDTVLDFQIPAVQAPGYQSEFPLVGFKGLLAAAFLDGIVSARKSMRAKMGQKIRREAREWVQSTETTMLSFEWYCTLFGIVDIAGARRHILKNP